MTESPLFPYLLLLTAGIIWGATFSLALIATAGGAHPLGISAWQVVLTMAFFLLVCMVSRVPLFRLAHLRHYLVLALVGITAPNLFYYYAAPHLSAGILAITVSTVPLFTYFIMLLLRYESLVARRLSGIVLGMIAILLLVVPEKGLGNGDASFWVLLVVLCALLYAIENVYIGRGIPGHIDVRELLFASSVVAGLIQFPLAIYLGIDQPWDWLGSDAGLSTIALALGSSVAYMMFFYTIKISGPVFASQCAYAVTISGVIWGILVFSEQHSTWVWISVMVMLVGLVMVNPDDEEDTGEFNKIASVESPP